MLSFVILFLVFFALFFEFYRIISVSNTKWDVKALLFPLFNSLFDLPTGKSFLMVLDLRHASWPLRKSCHPSLYPAVPARGLPGGLFPGILPSMTNGTWSPCRRVWPSQTLCLLLITDMMALSSPTRLNTSLLQTLSDQFMFKTFLQSHIPQLSSLRTSSFFKVYHSAPFRKVPQMTVFIILFFRQRLARWRLLSAVLFS